MRTKRAGKITARAARRGTRYAATLAARPYVLREPTTGLYAVIGDPGTEPAARLDYEKNATRFPSHTDALIAAHAAGIASQPHEIERVDA